MRLFWRMSLVVCGLLLLGAAPASAGRFYGPVWINTSYQTHAGPEGMTVKFCTGWNGTGMCYQDTTSRHCWNLSCTTGWFDLNLPDRVQLYMFVTGPGNVGSDSSPSHGRFENSNQFTTSIILSGDIFTPFYIYTYPNPLPPSAIYPANGQQNAPLSFTLKWTSGVNHDRSTFPVTYDIYSHGEGASDLLVASNIPCNPDASGYCTLAVNDVKSSSYIYWRVVAKLNPGLFPTHPYYTTNSPTFTFTTLTDPNVTISFMTNDWTHHLNPVGAAPGR